MIKVALITRSTLFTIRGGDTIKVVQSAKHLNAIGVAADIRLTNEKIPYGQYDLLHFFNITRPADILYHVHKSKKPFVVSPILIDYSEYDKFHRTGLFKMIFRFLSANKIEYLKTVARWIKGKDNLKSFSYLWKGHHNSIKEILNKTKRLLPNSDMEYAQLVKVFQINLPYTTVPDAVDYCLFKPDNNLKKDPLLVLCIARIEGLKNQLNLIKALNNTAYKLLIIGAPAPNQLHYYHQCRNIAGKNIVFIDHLPQDELVQYYQKAKVHVLPSWFETCGLSSLEATAMGCNIVISRKGFTSEYFEDMAFYCDPASPASILKAIETAAASEIKKELREKISVQYTWQQAAIKTLAGYKKAIAL